MKFSQVDGTVYGKTEYSVHYTFVVIATNCDIIMTSSVVKIRI